MERLRLLSERRKIKLDYKGSQVWEKGDVMQTFKTLKCVYLCVFIDALNNKIHNFKTGTCIRKTSRQLHQK